MADITRRLGWRHLRGAPTAHIRHHRSGRLLHDGPGLSFWFRSLTAALSEVPVDDRELAILLHAELEPAAQAGVNDALLQIGFSISAEAQVRVVNDYLLQNALATLWRCGFGFLLACLTGIPLGLAMGTWPAARAACNYIVEFMRPLPPLSPTGRY